MSSFSKGPSRSPMSTQLSVLAFAVASWTWWHQPAPPLAIEIEVVPQPQAEFACSARCPASSVTIQSAASSWSSSLFWSSAGFLVCLALFLCCWLRWSLRAAPRAYPTQQLQLQSIALGGSEYISGPEETVPRLAIEGGLTPALRRRLREQRNYGQ